MKYLIAFFVILCINTFYVDSQIFDHIDISPFPMNNETFILSPFLTSQSFQVSIVFLEDFSGSANFEVVDVDENQMFSTEITSTNGLAQISISTNIFFSGTGVVYESPYTIIITTMGDLPVATIPFNVQAPYYEKSQSEQSSTTVTPITSSFGNYSSSGGPLCRFQQLLEIVNPNLYDYYYLNVDSYYTSLLVVGRSDNSSKLYMLMQTYYNYNYTFSYEIRNLLGSTLNNSIFLECNQKANIDLQAELILVENSAFFYILVSSNNKISVLKINGIDYLNPQRIWSGKNPNTYEYMVRNYKATYNQAVSVQVLSQTINLQITESKPQSSSTFSVSDVIGYEKYPSIVGGINYEINKLSMRFIINFTEQALKDLSFLVVIQSGGYILSDPIPIDTFHSNVSITVYSFLLIQPQDDVAIRGYYKTGGFFDSSLFSVTFQGNFPSNPIVFLQTLLNVTYYNSLPAVYSVTPFSNFFYPDLGSLFQAYFIVEGTNYPLSSKKLSVTFPLGCSGKKSRIDCIVNTPYLPDTPYGTTLNIYNPIFQVNPLNYKLEAYPLGEKFDIINPIIKLSILYDQAKLPDNEINDYIQVDVIDDIGVDYERCYFQYGPFIGKINHESRFIGTVRGKSSFLFPLKVNRYFCDARVILKCEDLRGYEIQWDSIDAFERGTEDLFYSKGDGCLDSLPQVLRNIDLISYDYSYSYENSGTILVKFQTTLLGISPQNVSNYRVVLKYGSSTVTLLPQNVPSNLKISVFSQSISINTTQTVNYNISMDIVYGSSSLHLSNDDLRYIGLELPIESSRFEPTFKLQEPTFKGFTINLMSFIENEDRSILFKLEPFVNISMVRFGFVPDLGKFGNDMLYLYNLSTTSNIIYQQPPQQVGYHFWIDMICDNLNNCQRYSIFYSIFSSSAGTSAQTPNWEQSIRSFTVVPKEISSNTQNRKSRATFYIQPKLNSINQNLPYFELDQNINPILYLIENDSFNKLSFEMTNIGNYSYEVEFEIPLNWGSRGISQIGVAQIYSTSYGEFYEYHWDSSVFNIVSSSNQPDIWTTLIDMSRPEALFLTGSNLGYLNEIEYRPSIISDRKYDVIGSYQYINSSYGYFLLPNNLVFVSGMNLTLGDDLDHPIKLFIISCMYPGCNGKGYCKYGSCICNPGWSGVDCSINLGYECLNNCTNQGTCENHICNCFEHFIGPSCSIKVTENTTPMNISSNALEPSSTMQTKSGSGDGGKITKESSETSFTIMLKMIQELDFHDNIIRQYNLTTLWNTKESNETTKEYSIELTKGCFMKVIIEISSDSSRVFEFANQSITLPPNSLKYYIKIENYDFFSSVNHLTFLWETAYIAPNPCETELQNQTLGGSADDDIHYIVIPANQLQLYGRFSNLIIVDDRILQSSNKATQVDDKLQIRVNIPFFQNSVELDPDFSVLLDYNSEPSGYEFDDECNILEKGLPKFAIPVIVVGSAVVLTAALTVTFVLLFKYSLSFKMAVLAWKLKFFVPKSSLGSQLTKF